MKLVMERNDVEDKFTVRLEINSGEYVRARLDNFDRILIRDCEGSDKVSDKLLMLETIARRIEEAESHDISNYETKSPVPTA